MKAKQYRNRLLTACAFVAIVYVFFVQARVVLRPIPVAFDPTEIAYGYSNVTFSGTVYHDEGVDAVSAGTGVAIHINGSATSTTTTNASGEYSFSSLTINNNDIVTVFINGEDGNGVLVAKVNDDELSDQSVTGMDIYKDRLILRSSDEDLNITTTNLNTANNGSDTDIDEVYTLANSNTDLVLGYNKELYIWSSTTHTTSGSIFTHDLDVRGTLTMGSSQNITASGSFVVFGDITTTGDVILTSVQSGEVLQVNGTELNNLYLDNGLEAYWRMDEGSGTDASSSTLDSQTGATLSGNAAYVQTTTGTTLFYNPYAVELDGDGDSLVVTDEYDLTTDSKKTFTGWFRRKSATTEDTIFAKKTASGSSNAGYTLYIDDESDQLVFELADGSNTYTVTSNSTITDQNWHHFGVSFDSLNNNATNIFIDGSIDVSAKTGSLSPSSNSVVNALGFIIGDNTAGTSPFVGTVDDFRIYTRAMSGSEISLLAAGNKATGSGTYDVRSPLNIDGDLSIYAGTLDVGTGHQLNVAGDVTAYGLLRTNSGTIVLDGSSQTIRGSTAFKQLTKSSSTEVTLTFESATEQTVSGALTIRGATNNRLKIRATVAGDEAFLIAESSGATLLKQLDVKDNNAFSGATLYCTEGCVDSGNNTNWFFLGECGDGVVNTGEQCDDGDNDNNDVCPNDCQLPVCGDTVVEGFEECEPPNVGSCLSNCLFRGSGGGGVGGFSSASSTASYFKRAEPPEGCGNSIFEPEKGEECDAGERFNGLGTCSFDCKTLTCGDGIISPQIGEDCEPTVIGTVNGIQTFEVAACGEVCTAPEVTAQGTVFGGCRRVFLQSCDAQQSSSSLPSSPARCGNGVVDAREECDFGGICEGGNFDGSFWTDRTSANTCISGGGTPKAASGDGCDDSCKTEFCGDGIIQKRGADNQPSTSDDEECDNGSICSNDPNKTCRLDTDCGIGNSCEYNTRSDGTCSDSCKVVATAQKPQQKPVDVKPSAPTPICGNGTIEGSEECDEGATNGSPTSTCTASCTERVYTPAAKPEAFCGNAIVDGDEQCDSGDNNSDVDPNACRTSCRAPSCGDFVVDKNEQCDNGDGNSDVYSDSCRTNCRLPYCGDGVLDSNEECDGGLSCLPNCQRALQQGRCGNGKIETGEQCDDGNTTPDDGCSRYCQLEPHKQTVQVVCGNGVIEAGEQCDDGNTDDNDGCSNECRIHEPQMRQVAAAELQLDADVIVVNPTEYATALKFLRTESPCSTLVIKGQNQKAAVIRAAALQKGIPIIRNIQLARSIYGNVNPGQVIFGDLCAEVNKIKEQVKRTNTIQVKPSAPEPPQPAQPKPQQIPQAPTEFAYGYWPTAQVSAIVTTAPPAGQTGPGLIGIGVAGVAAGAGWVRKRKK